MEHKQIESPSSLTYFLSLLLGLSVLVCIGCAVTAVVFYQRIAAAEEDANQASKQEHAAIAAAVKAEQQVETLQQAMRQTTFALAYYNHVLGAKPLTEAELAIVRPVVLNDPEMKKIDEQINADRERINEYIDKSEMVSDDYHTILDHACYRLKLLDTAFETSQAQHSATIVELDKTRARLDRALSRESSN